VDAPKHAQDANGVPAVAYARPHEIEVDRFSPGQEGFPVQLSRVLLVGPTARLEVEREDCPDVIEIELPAERVRSLNLKAGETLLVRPRRVQVFVEDPAGDAAAKPAAPEAAQLIPPGGAAPRYAAGLH
jgi:sulfate transport system ATP-binding protein